MKKIILLLLLIPTFAFSQNIISLENITNNQTFDVWISEGNDLIFTGRVFPNRKVLVPMTTGKLYGIKFEEVSKTSTAKEIPKLKDVMIPANTTIINDIEYYKCRDRDLIYRLVKYSKV